MQMSSNKKKKVKSWQSEKLMLKKTPKKSNQNFKAEANLNFLRDAMLIFRLSYAAKFREILGIFYFDLKFHLANRLQYLHQKFKFQEKHFW